MNIYSPINGKPRSILEFIIQQMNYVFHAEKWQLIDILEITDDPVIIWDYAETRSTYLKIPRHIFMPLSSDFDQMIWKGIPYQSELAVNFTVEHPVLMLFPVQSNYPSLIQVKDEQITFHADVFAQLFLLLSGWQEQFEEKDSLGRVLGMSSLQNQLQALNRALVDECYALLIYALHALGIPESVTFHEGHSWKVTLTHDVDHLKKFTFGYFFRRLFLGQKNPENEKTSVLNELNLWRNKKDPYVESLQDIINFYENNQAVPIFFLRSGKSDKRDGKLNYSHPLLKNLTSLAENKKIIIGLHPSIKSAENVEQFYNDWSQLKSNFPNAKPIVRQHFLMFDVKKTPSIHAQCGMMEDYSLGFHDVPGLRRSTVRSFYGFDFNEFKATQVLYTPLVVMDATFTNYSKTSIQDSIHQTEFILKEVQRFNGHVSILFHNNWTVDTGYFIWFRQVVQFIQSGYGYLGSDLKK